MLHERYSPLLWTRASTWSVGSLIPLRRPIFFINYTQSINQFLHVIPPRTQHYSFSESKPFILLIFASCVQNPLTIEKNLP